MTNNQPFTVFLIQSGHTDVGYTHPQEQIMRMYSDYYDKVLELCHRTEHDPILHRFKWVCETSWQVKTYLTAHPERTDEFVYFVRNGQIEITGAYLHFTDLIDEDAYRRSLDWVADFCKQHDLPLRTAMHCDINGWAWALPQLLQERGIGFFLSQIHIDSATDPLGKPGNVHYQWKLDVPSWMKPDTGTRTPHAFWWQAPNGQRVLHWLGEHYHLGNVLGLSGMFQFGLLKTRHFWETDRDPAEKLYARAIRELPRYLDHIRAQGYPYNSTLISLNGYMVDNSAPDLRWCEVIARWNAEHDHIKLRTATVSEWYDHLLTLDDGTWPTYQMAWPDHWAHGLGSMSARIGQARSTQRRRADAITLAQHAHKPKIDQLVEDGLEQERLSLEHTFNAWMTTYMPWHPQNNFLQSYKELTFQRAELYFDEAIAIALRDLAPLDAEHQKIYVRVPDDAPAVTLLEFSSGDYHIDAETQELIDPDGTAHSIQRDTHSKDRPRFVASLPAREPGLHGYYLRTKNKHNGHTQKGPTALENEHWNIALDPETGGLLSLREAGSGREWAGDHPNYRFGQMVHEAVIHPAGRSAVSNAMRLVVQGTASDKLREEIGEHPVFSYTMPTMQDEPTFAAGDVFDMLSINGELRNDAFTIGKIGIGWRLYHALPLVELVIDWQKAFVELPEAAYVTFPFQNVSESLNLETAGGFFQPGSHTAGGQLPGTVSSYYTIQRAAHIQSPDDSALVWLPLEAPLVMLQDINFNNWDRGAFVWNGFLASMPVNHYWHTNFARSQQGHIRLRYRFLSVRGFADREAAIRAATPTEALGWR
jgi:hypothetical protein